MHGGVLCMYVYSTNTLDTIHPSLHLLLCLSEVANVQSCVVFPFFRKSIPSSIIAVLGDMVDLLCIGTVWIPYIQCLPPVDSQTEVVYFLFLEYAPYHIVVNM